MRLSSPTFARAWSIVGILACPSLASAQPDLPSRTAEPVGLLQAMATVNEQASFVAMFGERFPDEAWESPVAVLPAELKEFKYLSGPADKGLSAKEVWRKPLCYEHTPTGTLIAVTCYRQRGDKLAAADAGTPVARGNEPAYEYRTIDFHDLKAAVGHTETHDSLVFQHGERLIKVQASGADNDMRADVAAKIWQRLDR